MTALRNLIAEMDGPSKALALSILALVIVGGFVHSQFYSPTYLLQQLQTGAFLGIVATGALIVILLGEIDLSIPWTMTAAALLSTAVVGPHPQPFVSEIGLLVGLATGVGIGLVNGIGVAYMRIPSMIWTLAVNTVVLGLCVYLGDMFTLGSRPSLAMSTLGAGKTFGVANVTLVWLTIGMLMAFILRKTIFGRHLYFVGNREAAAFLSGVDTRRVTLLAFVASGLLNGAAGLLLAGYAGQSYGHMGDPYLLSAIAAVVLGGASLFGGRGSYAGTALGVMLITLISSVLSIMQAPEAAKQIIYGVVIIGMVGYYSRRERFA
ncbi:ABC transporter permease [Mesorhizobium sp. M2A.F.Ca.ET.039.01.1.1]|uniref:ABC transporter permease n=1 Tax=Mesorhizobium sp. M2A.F.Ca.ET.039.01.1.1 TaxID=2496746 RepID=UPI000FCC3DD2|nr:ABC transporter permease [Mesorhizobium sp. M2A.F.Ca.ET.039.01.1.1]RWX71930.1 ABC transporter permease [Mesorhizobium sp. M2A.F.Ca.ET.039.01.1.1]TIV34369.1 MAG: ABC transporter permease [Mesorhizobium sp.]TIV47591.1 MAG: ABC transporter permease [Mesorhizobium sp.]